MREGYLWMWPESYDEVHIYLISKEQMEEYSKLADGWESDWLAAKRRCLEYLLSIEPIEKWFTQTHCQEDWPYGDVKILGTLCFDPN